MITDTEVRIKGINVLADALGDVDAERFIALVMREPFDYTKWQRKIWAEKTVDEISAAAMKFREA